MTALLGVLALHLAGALVLRLTGVPLRDALRSTTSLWVSLAVLSLASLGVAGVPLGLVGALLAWRLRPAGLVGGRARWGFLGLGVVVLARPWVPTFWDELVWLGKARVESLGFGAQVAAALDPAQRLFPPGYPPLWPSAVGWLSLGADALDAQVVAGSLVVLFAAFAVLESFAWLEVRPQALLVVLATPLVWVHLRSVYVDLPVGLLSAALLGRLLDPKGPDLVAVALAVVLAGFKDEGLALAACATLGGWVGSRSWRSALPLAAALGVTVTWHLLLRAHEVSVVDHALGTPYWPWLPTGLRLVVFHATDLATWGVFWPLALVAVLVAPRDRALRPFAATLTAGMLFLLAATLAGPEQVRAFAENGTLLNRLLLQQWPVAAAMVAMLVGKLQMK